MNLEIAKQKIDMIVDALSSIEDYESFAKNNELEWKKILQQLIANYKYIIQNTDQNNKIQKDIIEKILSLKSNNHTMSKIIDHILNDNMIDLTKKLEEDDILPEQLIENIESYIKRIENYDFYDTETINDIYSNLNILKKQLETQKTYIEFTTYLKLSQELERHITIINNTLAHIEANEIKFKF